MRNPFEKKPSRPAERVAQRARLELCAFVSTVTKKRCTHIAEFQCYFCGLKLCRLCANINEREDSQGRAQHRYCLDCYVKVKTSKATAYQDVQPLQVYEDHQYQPRRSADDPKW